MSDQHQFYVFNEQRGARYYAVRSLDEGGFGWVWSGTTAEGLPIAIKVFKPTSDFTRDFESWFTEQQVYLRCLQHQYIVSTYDQFYSPNHGLVIVMEKAEGSLDELVHANGALNPTWVSAIGCQILSALHFIHTQGIVHRDVSLKNILWFPGGVFKLADFGISKQGVGIEQYARTFIGHKSYIPPELILAKYSTHQSDLYQLGLVLLTLLTGEHPIPLSATVEETRELILNGVPRQIADSLVPSFGNLAGIISVMLRRRDRWRYQNAMAVWTDLDKEFKHLERIQEIQRLLLQSEKPTPTGWPWTPSESDPFQSS